MEKKKTRLVTFDQACKLKNLGLVFDTEYIYDYYHDNIKIKKSNDYYDTEYAVPAPTRNVVLDWIREEKELHGFCNRDDLGWFFKICKTSDGTIVYDLIDFETNKFDTYEACEIALIDKLIEILKKINV